MNRTEIPPAARQDRSLTARFAAVLAAAGLALAGLVLTTPAAAYAASCGTWTQVNYPGNFYLQGNLAGQVWQEWNNCHPYSVRGHFRWNQAWRTAAHPPITGAYVQVLLETRGNDGVDTVREFTGLSGSSGPVDVTTDPQSSVNLGTSIYYARADVSTGWPVTLGTDWRNCYAQGTVHDYSNGGVIENSVWGYCSTGNNS